MFYMLILNFYAYNLNLGYVISLKFVPMLKPPHNSLQVEAPNILITAQNQNIE